MCVHMCVKDYWLLRKNVIRPGSMAPFKNKALGFDFQNPCKRKLGMVVNTCDPTSGKAEMGRSQQLTNQLVSRSPGSSQHFSSVHGGLLASLRFRALGRWEAVSASACLLTLPTP